MSPHPSRADVNASDSTRAPGLHVVAACALLCAVVAAGGLAMLGDVRSDRVPGWRVIEVTNTRPALRQTNAGIEVTVPNGAAAAYSASGHGFSLPAVIRMETGQQVAVRNEDSLTHVILGLPVPAGGTVTRVLERPGYEVYSAGCAAHAAAPEMTTLIVRDAGERGVAGGA